MKLTNVLVPARWYRVERPWSTNPICWFLGHEMSLLYPSRLAGKGDLHKWECERCHRQMGTMGPFFNESAFFYWGRCGDLIDRVERWKVDHAEFASGSKPLDR